MSLKILADIWPTLNAYAHKVEVGIENKDTYLTATKYLTLDEIEDLEIQLIELTKQLADYRRRNE